MNTTANEELALLQAAAQPTRVFALLCYEEGYPCFYGAYSTEAKAKAAAAAVSADVWDETNMPLRWEPASDRWTPTGAWNAYLASDPDGDNPQWQVCESVVDHEAA